MGFLLGKRTVKLKLPKMPKAVLKVEDWLKTHKASEIEEAALLLGLAGLSFKVFGQSEETVTETYISGYREETVLDYGTTLGEELGVSGMFFRQPQFRTVTGSHVVRTPIYSTREVKKMVYHPEALLYGPVAIKLAQSGNIVAGTSGVIGLALLGLANLGPDLDLIDIGPNPKLGVNLLGAPKFARP